MEKIEKIVGSMEEGEKKSEGRERVQVHQRAPSRGRPFPMSQTD